ncbi:MAG: hypothetical protein LKCHEGNO_00037 [Burkholderiaceae bacterium]|nr:hypothetical protein [Burkholderiaceae bacterium]
MTTPTPVRLPPAIDTALQRVRLAARKAAEKSVNGLGLAALSATSTAQRDALLGGQFELNRKMAVFAATFNEAMEDSVVREVRPRSSSPTGPTTWDMMTLVEDHEVEIKVLADRFALDIQNQCEWELRQLDTYMGAVLHLKSADSDRNPLRPEVIGRALVRAIETIADRTEVRKALSLEVGRTLAAAMRQTYLDVMGDLRAAGVAPLKMTVRATEGPGSNVGSVDNGYEHAHSTGAGALNSGPGALAGSNAGGSRRASGLNASSGVSGGPSAGRNDGAPAAFARSSRGSGVDGFAASARDPNDLTRFPATELAGDGRSGRASGSGATLGQIDPELMGLLRRLAYTAPPDVVSAPTTGGGLHGTIHALHSGAGALAGPNLIVAHREELRQAATGALDHMVIDVVGGLFDQILSDPKVPPQMARQIGRLQLPVLRAALGDPTFFSSRRHPVRRFVNRIASLGVAFDDLDDGDGKAFIKLVKDLVQQIVEGDFDQIQLYEQKLEDLESFVVDQNRREVQRRGNADEVLAQKENQLRLQQRYAAQLRHGLNDVPAPDFLRDFVSSVWSQAVMKTALDEGHDSPAVARLRLAGRDLLMSVQPKGSPAQRKAFLIALPTLMKTLNAGMDMIKWPEVARKDFFGKLLPAHAESLKGEAMRTLDYNLLLKQVDVVLGAPIPKTSELPPMPASELPVLLDAVQANTFTEAEAKAIGLVDEHSIDWAGKLDVEIEAEPEVNEVDIQIDGMPEPEPVEPSRGGSLADHVQIGFAYQMHIDGQWQKVRLSHVSAGRTFFVFTRGQKHVRTISMTYRMLAKMCEADRLRAFEHAYLLERATARARAQLAQLSVGGSKAAPKAAASGQAAAPAQLVRH